MNKKSKSSPVIGVSQENKNDFSTHSLDTLLALTTKTLKKTGEVANPLPTGDGTAIKISAALSVIYRQKSESEWEWLRINRPEWWAKRAELENAVDGCFLDGNPKAAQEPFDRLVDHLKTATGTNKTLL